MKVKVSVVFDRLNSLGELEKKTERYSIFEANNKHVAKKDYLIKLKTQEPNLKRIHAITVKEVK